MPRTLATLLLIMFAGRGAAVAGITGTVREDGSGLPVAGAIVATKTGPERVIRTDSAGTFLLPGPIEAPLDLFIRAAGLEPILLKGVADGAHVDVVLTPARLHETITVTARGSAQRLSETAQSVITVPQEKLTRAAAPAVDDVLRQVPGFSLFRRSGSRVANPTAQGVSLRGIGPSGASRSLVLLDGIPLNDPFGGWVAWGRVARVALRGAEILRGGGSELYGSSALSGVVSLLPRTDAPAVSLDAGVGSDDLEQLSLYASTPLGPVLATVAAEYLQAGGYVLVREEERGPVDVPAGSDRHLADVRLALPFSSGTATIRAARFEEKRDNGTVLQVNETRLDELSGGIDTLLGGAVISARLYRTIEDYFQTFSAVSADRTTEQLTRIQDVPSSATGASLVAGFSPSAATAITAGIDLRHVRGATEETVAATSTRITAGGTMESRGGFVQLLGQHNRLSMDATLRFDEWKTSDAFRTSASARTPLPARNDSALSPRLSLLWKLTDQLSLSSSAYRGFRAPTLNELYRSFRVGNVVTEANELLEPETAGGFELGTHFSPYASALFRLNAFWMELEDAVANITTSSTPELIRRRRENVGRTRSRGVEIDAQLSQLRMLELDAGYLYVDASVLEFAPNRVLEGRRIPQVPEHQFSFGARLNAPHFSAALQARTSSKQYEDDLNSLSLGDATTVDLLLETAPMRHLSFYAAGENMFDERFAVGRTPVTTLSPPRQFRFGLRYDR